MNISRRIRYWLNSHQHYHDLRHEMEFHRAMLYGSGGHRTAMGNVTMALEDSRRVWIWPWLESLVQDTRYALRSLRRQPGFALIAVLALGVAIGLNTSLFTVFDAVALRLYAVNDPPRFVKIFSLRNHVNAEPGFSIQEFRYLASHSRTFAGMIVMHDAFAHFGFEPFSKTTHGMFVAADHFDVIGLPMQLGRGFLTEEDAVDSPRRVVVLSDTIWRNQFDGDPAILGKQVRLDDKPFTVVGVAAKNFRGTSQNREDFWVPLAALPLIYPNDRWPRNLLAKPDACCSFAAGRLKRGVSRIQATVELDVLSRQFHAQFHLEPARIQITEATMIAGNPASLSMLPIFALMFVGVTLVVLLACANTGNLLVARAVARRREFEVRQALGAGRARIVRQLLTESFVLSLGAAAIGLVLAWRLPTFAVSRMVSRGGEFPPIELTPDLAVFGYALVLAVLTCLGFGLAPALYGTRNASLDTRMPIRGVLLSVQMAISVALLIGAGLLAESVRRVRAHDPGFSTRDVAVVSIELPPGSYDRARIRSFSEKLWRELRGQTTVAPFALTAYEPLSNSLWAGAVRLPGEDQTHEREVSTQSVSTGYFDVLRIPILAGRDFGPSDTMRSILVNETLARGLWRDASPVGRIVLAGNMVHEVVGVVRDSYSFSLDRVEPALYTPFGGGLTPKVLVRSGVPGTTQAVERIVAQIDNRAHTNTLSLADNVSHWGTGIKVAAEMAAVLGVFALALSAIGMAGVFAFVVQGRTKEIGIRMALGARRRHVIALVLGSASRALAIGVSVGYVAAAALARLMTGFLFGVSSLDVRIYIAAGLFLCLAGIAAGFIPASRAVSIDPSRALRCE